jgi:proteic killer suppression protein
VLGALQRAQRPDDLRLPGFGLHPLKGKRRGEWSITVTRNWRVTFKFDGTNVIDVNLEDYH